MKILDNFLTSGHRFSKDESLKQFRFSFLNILMVFASFITLLNSLASMFGTIDFGSTFEKATFFYVVISIFVIYLLRKNKSYYPYVVNFFIATSLMLFYFVLLTRPEDEFRLVAFFLALFISYVLLGKKYRVFIYLLVTSSILYINSILLNMDKILNKKNGQPISYRKSRWNSVFNRTYVTNN